MRIEGGLRYAEGLALAQRGRWRSAGTRCLAALAEDADDPLLTFLSGPLRIFYVSILWAVVFVVLALVVAVLTLGLGLLLV